MRQDASMLKAGRVPLDGYPWREEVDRLLSWLLSQEAHVKAFCFDLIMSAAYIDATSGLEKYIEQCDRSPKKYNAHIGFINLCSPCYTTHQEWRFQGAVKPQSGALGKLSSELILRFIEKLYPAFTEVLAVGGSESADAILTHNSGMKIFAEVKSAPLLTYPFLFEVAEECLNGQHKKITITQSQLKECKSAVYLHNGDSIALGKTGDPLWPFKPIVDFILNHANTEVIEKCISGWLEAKAAYRFKDKNSKMYYLANASGQPPKVAKEKDAWPKGQSISDGKTSAGMDRTDDIKKAVYQTLKIGANLKNEGNYRTAIISNLPAYRHGADYVAPFSNMYWGLESDVSLMEEVQVIKLDKLSRVFDYIITLDDPVLRDTTI